MPSWSLEQANGATRLLTKRCICAGAPGKVIQLSSVLGEAEMPYQAVYSAAKHGLEAMTSCMRRELKPYGIKFVCIRPNVTASELWEKVGWSGIYISAERHLPSDRSGYLKLVLFKCAHSALSCVSVKHHWH